MGGAETRDQSSVVLDVSRMNQLIDMNEENLTVTVGAGMFLRDLENYVQEKATRWDIILNQLSKRK